MLPDCSGWSRFLANGFGLVQACNMHRSLPGRIGGKCFAISDRFATQFTTLRRASVLCSDGLCSRNRPIVGRTQEGAPFEAGIFGRSICSHSKTSVAEIAVSIRPKCKATSKLRNEIGDNNFGSSNHVRGGVSPALRSKAPRVARRRHSVKANFGRYRHLKKISHSPVRPETSHLRRSSRLSSALKQV